MLLDVATLAVHYQLPGKKYQQNACVAVVAAFQLLAAEAADDCQAREQPVAE